MKIGIPCNKYCEHSTVCKYMNETIQYVEAISNEIADLNVQFGNVSENLILEPVCKHFKR